MSELRPQSTRYLTRVRGALTIAEDALRAIAAPDCGLELAEDGYTSYDTSAAGQIAEGALLRIEQALNG